MQFFFSPLAQEQVEEVLRRERADLPAAQRKIAAQMAEGSPGVALALNLEEASELRQSVFQILVGDDRAAFRDGVVRGNGAAG